MEKGLYEIIGRQEDDGLIYLRLKPANKKNISFEAGQFAKITSLEKKDEPKFRFYSIASSPLEPYLEFVIKVVGRFTNYLSALKKGDVLEIEGPYGHFKYENQKKVIFIAGGVGIAPIMSILRFIDKKKIKGNFVFFYSNRNERFAYFEELKKLGKNPNMKIIFTITREAPPDWEGEQERISAGLIIKYLPDAADYSAYMCGPLEMTQNLRKELIGLGIGEKNIRLEGWG